VRVLADKNFELLKADARHGSLHLKKIAADVYSVRVGLEYRAPAFDRGHTPHLVLDRPAR